ncbi:MAG: DUF1493 family protein [Rhizobiales bacterium]|nr:DUF1493 family protein [Hyphomicrobiales bacterium]
MTRVQSSSEMGGIVLSLIRHISGVANVTPKDRLYHDLRILGMDAMELLETLNHRFGTDFSGLDFELHFPNEHPALSIRLKEALKGSEQVFRPITVKQLLEAVQIGRWA